MVLKKLDQSGVGGNYTVTSASNGLVTSGYYDGFHSVVRNDSRKQESSLSSFGANLEYQLNENWVLDFDISTGKVDKTLADVESYSGVGRAGVDGRPVSARSFQMTENGVFFSNHPTVAPVDLTDPNLVRLGWATSMGWRFKPDSTIWWRWQFSARWLY